MSEADYIQLVLKHLDSEASPAEQAALQSWLEADPQNRREYQALEKIWNDSGRRLNTYQFDVEAALDKVRHRLTGETPATATPAPARTLPWQRTLAAASILLVIGTAAWWYSTHSGTPQTSIFAETANQSITLPDGSLVHLRKGATLTYPASLKNDRTVELSGEAFFEPTADAASPFLIRTAHALFQDIGTSFLVNDQPISDELTVITGKVKFSEKANPANSMILTEGKKAQLSGSSFTLMSAGARNVLAWKTGILDFKDQPLRDVAADIADYYQTSIAIDPKLAEKASTIKVTARFEHQPLQEVLEEMRLMTGLSTRKEKDTFVLTGQSSVPRH